MLVHASEVIKTVVYQDKIEFLNSSSKGKRRPKILLIDDDIDMGGIIKNTLKFAYNCRVDIASDPFEAMNTMVENFYDLIILDWNLPLLNGAQTLKELEKGFYFDPSLPVQWDRQRVPVVVFSASDKIQCSLARSKHFDCAGFVSKRQTLSNIIASFAPYILVNIQESAS
ncbi:MAG: response regulator [Pseudobdellovibrio sp.]